jgi:chromosomal replication initiation ATPase DnaA
MYNEHEEPAERYSGMNPDFVRRVWAKRQQEKDEGRKQEMARLRDERNKARRMAKANERQLREQVAKQAELRGQLNEAQIALRVAIQQQEEAMRLYRLAADVEDPQSAREIITQVALRHGFRYSEIIGPSRNKAVVLARHEAMVEVARRKPNYSVPMIGKAFNRDHTTILHALNKAGFRRNAQNINGDMRK